MIEELHTTTIEPHRPRRRGVKREAPLATKEVKTQSADEKKEEERRAEIGRIFLKAVELDHEWIRDIRSTKNETPEAAARYAETLESLTFGKELSIQSVGTHGRNGVTRRVFKGTTPSAEQRGTPPRVAYVKPQSEDVVFRTDLISEIENDQELYTTVQTQEIWNEKTKKFETEIAPVREGEEEAFAHIKKRRDTYIFTIAQYYKISTEEANIYKNGYSLRTSIEARGSTIREYVASRLNEVIKFDTIPLTVLRTSEDNHDLYSAQEAMVTTEGKPHPPSRINAEQYEEIRALGPKHPAAKSFMRLAVMDFLLRSVDRAPWNIIYDPEKQAFKGIDNGLCLGLSAAVPDSDPKNNGRDLSQVFSLDHLAFESLPMEITQMHEDWMLDDEAHASLAEFLDKCTVYFEKMDGTPYSFMREVMADTSGSNPEVKYCAKLFNLLYKNEKIASREFLNYVQRIEYIVENRRPPTLKIGSELSDYTKETAGPDTDEAKTERMAQ